MDWPLARASTCAAVNSCASRMASWRKARAVLSPKADTLAKAVAMPMMTKTIIISSSVKPCWDSARWSAIPGTDVGIDAFASGLPVGAQRKHVDFAVHPRIQILIGGVPGIVGHAVHIRRAIALPAYQHAKTLLVRGIAPMIQAV